MRNFLFFVTFLLIASVSFSQKSEELPVRLITANQSNSAPKSTQRIATPNAPLKKGHDVYSFIFVADENANIKVMSVWIKDKTTIPLYIDLDKKPKAANIRKGDQFTLKAEANGIYPYLKAPKRFSGEALIECEVNRQKQYFEVKSFLNEE